MIRLEVDSGPAGDSTYDWALWTSPRLIYNDLNRKKIQVFSPKPIKCIIPARDNESLKSIGKNAYELEVSTGSTYFLFEKPQAVKMPANLRDLKYEVKLRKTGGREVEPYGFAGASLEELTIDGITKKGLNAHPPFNGETQIMFLLNLPKEKLAFTGSAGINNEAKGKSDGVEFSVFVNGEKLWTKIVQAGEGWSDFKLPLDKYEGQPVIICLATNSLAKSDYDWAFWGDLKITKQDDKK